MASIEPRVSRRVYTAEEALDLFFSLDNGGELPSSILEDEDSDDGDTEEPDFVTEDGEGHLVPNDLLASATSILTEPDEPALRDSLLYCDNDLAEDISHELPPEPSPVSDSEAELQMDIDGLPSDNDGMSDECPSRVGEDFLSPGDTVSDDEENAESQDSEDSENDSVMGRGASHRRYRWRGTVGRIRGTARVRGRRSAIRGRAIRRPSDKTRRGRGRSRRGRVSTSRSGAIGRGRTGRRVPMIPPNWEWMDTYCNDSSSSTPPNFDEVTGPSTEAFACETPEEFFRLLFPGELVEHIVENTNLYASQKGVPIVFTKDDILGFIGLNIAMGIHSLPATRDYWAREPLLRSPWFSSVMPRDKFMAISRFLHFTDNSKALSRGDPNYDRLWKIRPAIQKIQEQSQKMYTPGEKVSIDESMIGTKARLSFLQYMPKKPTKWGVKVWVLSEAKTGYIYRFNVYTGKGETSEKGLAYGVVLQLMEWLLDSGRILYCDNFYSSPTLFEDLYERGIYASGTVRTNKKHFPSDLVDKKVDKGDAKFKHHGVLTAGKWVDKRDVYFLSTLYCDEVEAIERRGAGGSREEITKPKIVTDYNQFMSGVDIADQLMVYYACGRKSMKWYKRVFWRLIDHAILNAYILFKAVTGSNLSQKKFRIDLAYALTAALSSSRMGRGRSPSDTGLTRLQGKHFGHIEADRERGVLCVHMKESVLILPHERIQKRRIFAESVRYMYAMVHALNATIHL